MVKTFLCERGASKPCCGCVCQITIRHGLSVNWPLGEIYAKTQPEIVNGDKEINGSLEELRSRSEMRIPFSVAWDATKKKI